MKSAFDRPCVQHTKVEVLLYEGKIIGKMVTGISNNFTGTTTTLIIEENAMPFQRKKIIISKTIAGGGMDFASETKYFCLLELIKITDNEEFVNDKLQQKGATLKRIFETYFQIEFVEIL